MTRDDAIKEFNSRLNKDGNAAWSERWIDALVALGMLELDEPKGPEKKFKEVIAAIRWDNRYAETIMEAAREAGLKIVEK